MKNTSPGKKSATGRKNKSRPGGKTAASQKIQRAEQKETSIQTLQDTGVRYHRLVGTNSGLIKVHRELGKASTLTVYLPISRKENES
jgi:hypothetical protein